MSLPGAPLTSAAEVCRHSIHSQFDEDSAHMARARLFVPARRTALPRRQADHGRRINMPDWSIKIVPAPAGGGAAFQPDVQGAKPGDPLNAQQDDLVSWNNTTQETHQPWQTDWNYQPLSDAWVYSHPDLYMSAPVPSQRSSSPGYDAAQPSTFVPRPKNNAPPPTNNPPPQVPQPPSSWTIYYCCKTHPNRMSERGTIIVSVIPNS
jgi:hypothetical protein